MSNQVTDIFRKVAKLNTEDDRRQGNVVYIDDAEDVIVTGDLHGNRKALAKILKYAQLDKHPTRRLILQEIIHGPAEARSGQDRSIELLVSAAKLKLRHPRQVLFVMGNHDLAELTDTEISRAGQPSRKMFRKGVKYSFGSVHTDRIFDALGEYFLSLPLAIRCPNSVWISHSLPSSESLPNDYFTVLGRAIEPQDARRGGAAYQWTWGRRHKAEQIQQIAARLQANFFVIGHLHPANGYKLISDKAISLASDHSRGCLMHFSATDPLDTAEAAQAAIHPIASLMV